MKILVSIVSFHIPSKFKSGRWKLWEERITWLCLKKAYKNVEIAYRVIKLLNEHRL